MIEGFSGVCDLLNNYIIIQEYFNRVLAVERGQQSHHHVTQREQL